MQHKYKVGQTVESDYGTLTITKLINTTLDPSYLKAELKLREEYGCEVGGVNYQGYEIGGPIYLVRDQSGYITPIHESEIDEG